MQACKLYLDALEALWGLSCCWHLCFHNVHCLAVAKDASLKQLEQVIHMRCGNKAGHQCYICLQWMSYLLIMDDQLLTEISSICSVTVAIVYSPSFSAWRIHTHLRRCSHISESRGASKSSSKYSFCVLILYFPQCSSNTKLSQYCTYCFPDANLHGFFFSSTFLP